MLTTKIDHVEVITDIYLVCSNKTSEASKFLNGLKHDHVALARGFKSNIA
jgi:hypothetical protein